MKPFSSADELYLKNQIWELNLLVGQLRLRWKYLICESHLSSFVLAFRVEFCFNRNSSSITSCLYSSLHGHIAQCLAKFAVHIFGRCRNMNIFQSAQPSLLERAWLVLRYPYDVVRHPLDALLSVPALSFLLIPTFSSYSTSLNLLFFYVTWSTLILSNSPLKIEILGTLGIRVLFYLLPALAFLAFDAATPNLAVKLKEHGETALPMGEEQGGPKGRWWKVALISTANVLLGVAVQSSVELLFTKVLHIRSALKVTTTLPMPWGIAIDLIRGLFLREVSDSPPEEHDGG